jgi:hypothetical protein
LPLTEYPERTQGIGYYRSAVFKIMANAEGAELEIGDGGFVGWTAELIPDAKDRCLIFLRSRRTAGRFSARDLAAD